MDAARLPGAASTLLLSSLSAGALVYALGFVAWSIYFGSVDLGFHILPPQRYLLAGLLVAVLLAPSLLLEVWYFRRGWLERTSIYDAPGLWLQMALTAGRLFGFALWFYVIVHVTDLLGVLELTGFQTWLVAFATPFPPAFLWLVIAVLGFVGQPVRSLLGDLLERSRLGRMEVNERTAARLPRMLPAVLLAFALLVWGTFVPTAFGYLVLSNVTPEYGGAMVQTARLAFDEADLPPSLAAKLIEPGQNGTAVWSRPVGVLLLTESAIVFRLPEDPNRYEVQRSILQAISWEPRSH